MQDYLQVVGKLEFFLAPTHQGLETVKRGSILLHDFHRKLLGLGMHVAAFLPFEPPLIVS